MIHPYIDRCVFHDDFFGHLSPPLTASSDGSPWVKADTSAAGSPVVSTITPSVSGVMALTLASNNEIENLCLYWGDHLAIDIDMIQWIEMGVRLTSPLDAATSAAWGLASARNDAIDSIAHAALFRAIGSNAVLVETDDGVLDNDDVPTTFSTTAGFRRYKIDFSNGKSDVRFHMEDSSGVMRRLLASRKFDMRNYSGSLQPFFQIQKTADTNVNSLAIDYVRFEQRRR